MHTVYRTYADGELLYSGESLEQAVRTWDAATYQGPAPAGGVSVATYADEPYGLLQTRDGWILHVRENGAVYLNPNVGREAS